MLANDSREIAFLIGANGEFSTIDAFLEVVNRNIEIFFSSLLFLRGYKSCELKYDHLKIFIGMLSVKLEGKFLS